MQTIPRLPAAPSAPESRHEALTRERLCEVVERLLVSDRRGPDPQVRMTLRDDFLPGVAVCVQQAAGQLVVAFECTARASQHRLDKSAVGIARTLAHRLRCDVVVRVRATDGDDESLPDREVFAGQDEASP